MRKKSVRDVEVEGKRVLMRVDFNVPLENGTVADDTRIRAVLPTLNYLRERGAKVVLMSHLGRPKGQRKPELSLAPVAQRLGELLGVSVAFVQDCIGPEVAAAVERLDPGEVLLLENTRFHPEEEKNCPTFARKLAAVADLYVNDAFGAAHRAHASTVGLTDYLSPCVAGFLIEKELEVLRRLLTLPERPFVVVLGGAKVSDKIGVVENLLNLADKILLGGGLAYTFLKAQGKCIGQSLLDEEHLEAVQEVMAKAQEKGVELLLPVDVMAAQVPEGTRIPQDPEPEGMPHQIVDAAHIPDHWQGLDIGPQTRQQFREAVQGAKTIFWNGPMGVFEWPTFAAGTNAVAKALADSGAKVVVGGGESVAALQQAGVADKMYHICTGGGASLEFLEGRTLPGVEALDNVRPAVAAGNWKMHKTSGEARAFVQVLAPQLTDLKEVEVVLCAPFTALTALAEAVQGTPLKVGAQDLFWQESGAYTGEISPSMLKDAGCTHVIIGHSERRGRFGSYEEFADWNLLEVFGDNDWTVNAKVKAALAAGLRPIVCVGEMLAERERGETDDLIRLQLRRALHGLDAEEAAEVIIAYEPVWAIGTGKVCDAEEANRVIGVIRRTLAELYDQGTAETMRILYGGSIKPENIAGLMAQPEIDGGLVGGASLDPESFRQIIRACE